MQKMHYKCYFGTFYAHTVLCKYNAPDVPDLGKVYINCLYFHIKIIFEIQKCI